MAEVPSYIRSKPPDSCPPGGHIPTTSWVEPPACNRASRTVSTVSARPSRFCHHSSCPRHLSAKLQCRHWCSLGCGVKHGGILHPVAIKILRNKQREKLALQVTELCALPQPVVQRGLPGRRNRPPAAARGAGLPPAAPQRHVAARQQQAQQCTDRQQSAQLFQRSSPPSVENFPNHTVFSITRSGGESKSHSVNFPGTAPSLCRR